MAEMNSEIKYGMEIFSQFVFSDRIPQKDKEEMILEAVRLGRERADEVRKEFGNKTSRQLLTEFGIEIQMEDGKQDSSEDYVKFAEFYSKKGKILLNRKALKRLGRKMNPGLAEEIILCHELYHYFEVNRWGRTGDQFIRKVKLFGWIPVNRRMLPAAEIAANSFSKTFLHLDFNPQIIETYYFE